VFYCECVDPPLLRRVVAIFDVTAGVDLFGLVKKDRLDDGVRVGVGVAGDDGLSSSLSSSCSVLHRCVSGIGCSLDFCFLAMRLAVLDAALRDAIGRLGVGALIAASSSSSCLVVEVRVAYDRRVEWRRRIRSVTP